MSFARQHREIVEPTKGKEWDVFLPSDHKGECKFAPQLKTINQSKLNIKLAAETASSNYGAAIKHKNPVSDRVVKAATKEETFIPKMRKSALREKTNSSGYGQFVPKKEKLDPSKYRKEYDFKPQFMTKKAKRGKSSGYTTSSYRPQEKLALRGKVAVQAIREQEADKGIRKLPTAPTHQPVTVSRDPRTKKVRDIARKKELRREEELEARLGEDGAVDLYTQGQDYGGAGGIPYEGDAGY